jgi:hypothetical protein
VRQSTSIHIAIAGAETANAEKANSSNGRMHMYSDQSRPLSMDELEIVAGGESFGEAAGQFLDTLFNGPAKDPTPYIKAFLRGVEAGKKGQKA